MKLFARWKRKKILADPGVDVAERAARLYDAGYNCAQAVLQANCPEVSDGLVEMADVFGGGIDDSKCLCGAVTGGTMALSLRGKKKKASMLVERFRQEYRTTCCKGLTARFEWNSKEHITNCRDMTARTAEMVAELLRE
ncbi:MAG: hypothetical protein C0615_01745 [Desulfuromonas sp.]|nr:MAG: hypothetical protein C0615_01745 [Desulfuromonas sp.]